MTKILIIDDDSNICELLRMYLEKEGYEVRTASDGVEGVSSFRIYEPDLVLLDVMMPKKDGWQVCREIREHSSKPIIFISAKSETIDKVLGLELGADDYIEKPFSPSVLVARIRANLAQYDRLRQKGQDGMVTAGQLRLDPRSRRVFLGDREVPLKNKEYELLQFFMGNPGQVFDRETLYDRVWGLEAVGDSATVAVHINRLREKLGEGYIQTVRGAGYRFEG